MERGGRFHRYRRHAKQQASISSAASSGVNLLRANNPPNFNLPTNLNPSQANPTMVPNPQQPPQCTVREQDQYMPIANVIRIMRRILPAHAKISDDAKETIQECVSEYISFITGEANDRCQHEQRKTITAEDVLWSMGKLGFDDYVEPLTLFLNRYREAENERGSVRDPLLKRSNVGVVDYGNIGMPPFMPSFAVGPPPPQGVFDPAMFGAYYRDVSDAGAGMGGPSSSNNPYINFDPFTQFK
uniref:Nuclear transcription factor Y subunit B-14 n=1 Tax=Vernicia fordii TaxID=73154 RepID=A0A0H3XVU2_VERFO|nr:nuclear transcription factor Y subunit B-14 [Vernicia fordii]